MRRYLYEILLGDDQLTAKQWTEFYTAISRFVPILYGWRVRVVINQCTVYYFLESPIDLPASVNVDGFMLRKTDAELDDYGSLRGFMLNRWESNIVTIASQLRSTGRELVALEVNFRRFGDQIYSHSYVVLKIGGSVHTERLLRSSPGVLLAVNFRKAQTLSRHKIPKFLKLDKVSKILSSSAEAAILELQAFPYFRQAQYLSLSSYDFNRHSLILGSSGVGKSKFIAHFVHQLHNLSPEHYQVIIIDPHDSLKNDLVDIADRCEINFQKPEYSIDLFAATTKNVNVTVELTLGLFKSLIGGTYNSRLERVLRYSTYILSVAHEFNFSTLRRIILDVEYRELLLRKYQKHLPESVVQFFATDFQELKNQSYGEAIAPLVAFIDEMQMVPVFNETQSLASVLDLLDMNFLNIFSLNQLVLGHRVVQTIAGLLMQQLFVLAQRPDSHRHLIVIIDEVAVIESPILGRFLSELRKFHVSVILAGQYFAQISPELRSSIFANVTNYYLFHVSKADANLLVENLDIKPVQSESKSEHAKLITKLKTRECLVRIGHDGELYPLFQAKTLDQPKLVPIPAKVVPTAILRSAFDAAEEDEDDLEFDFGGVDVMSVMQANTTSRKKLSF